MVDMEKVEKLTSLLEERSGLGVREALIRYYDFLTTMKRWTMILSWVFFSINSVLRWIFRSDFCDFYDRTFGFL